MPYLICEKCDIYYEIHSKKGMLNTCECGNHLKYYDFLEEYLQKRGKIKKPAKNEEEFSKLLNNYETTVSKIILYCVTEFPFSLGINKTIQILRGSKSSFIIDYNLNKLNSYAVFTNFTKKRLERYIRTLIDQQLLKINYVSPYQNRPTLSLTDKGSEFLKGNKNLEVTIYGKNAVDYMQGVDKNLYNALRNLRKEIAREIEMSAYIVCSNEPLLEMARQKPTDYDSLIKIKGIGKRFIENYGERFLKVIKEHDSPANILNRINNAVIENTNRSDDESDLILTLLNNPDGGKRAHAAYIMGESRDPQYLKVLCQATRDKNGNVRRMAASALGKIGDESAVEVLVKLLSDPGSQIRQYSAKALGNIQSPKAIPFLEKSIDDEVPYVRVAARNAISKIKGSSESFGIR